MPPPLPNPDEIEAARPFLSALGALWKLAAGLATGLGIGGVWIWRASKAHSKYDDLQGRVKVLEDEKDTYVTLETLDQRQSLCKSQLALVFNDRWHDLADEMREDLAATNANICRIMDKMGLEPVQPKKRHRRRSDVPGH